MNTSLYNFSNQEGLACSINGKNSVSAFGAILKELTPVAGSISSSIVKAMSASHLRSSGYEVGLGSLKAIFYVYGETKELCYINTNRLIAECKDCLIQTDEDSFEHISMLSSFNFKETGVDFYNEVELTLASIKRLPLVSQVLTFNSDGVALFDNRGVSCSGLRLIVTPKTDLATLRLNEVTIKNLQSGQKFFLDGIDGKVSCNGMNRFLDTDLIEFPKVSPGENRVMVSPTDSSKVSVVAEYYPTFVI